MYNIVHYRCNVVRKISRAFSSCMTELLYLLNRNFLPLAMATTILLSASEFDSFRYAIQVESGVFFLLWLCDWFVSLSSHKFHTYRSIVYDFLFLKAWIFHCMYIPHLSIHLKISLCPPHDKVNNAAINIGLKYLFKFLFSILLAKYPKIGLLGYTVFVSSVFLGNLTSFSLAAKSACVF